MEYARRSLSALQRPTFLWPPYAQGNGAQGNRVAHYDPQGFNAESDNPMFGSAGGMPPQPPPGYSGAAPGTGSPTHRPWYRDAMVPSSHADLENPAQRQFGSSPQKGATGEGLKPTSSMLLIPAKFIKEKTWGTPRRRMCTKICMLIFAAIFIFLIVRLVDVLKILNSKPSVSEFRIADLCSDTITMNIAAQVLNPSSVGVTVRSMRVEVFMGSADDEDGAKLVAYVDTPDIYLGSGNASLAAEIKAAFPIEHADWTRKQLSSFLKNNPTDLHVKVPLTASFSPDVFIFPISYSTTRTIKLRLPALNGTSSKNETTDEEEEEEEKPRLIKMVELLAVKNPADYIAAQVALQLFTAKDFAKTFLDITAPPLNVDVFVDNQLALSGATKMFHYGKNLPSSIPSADLGTISVTAAVGSPNIEGIHYAINQVMNKGKIPLKAVLRGSNFNHPELQSSSSSTGSECHIQNVLDGVEFELELDIDKMLNPPPETTPTRSPTTPKPTMQPTVQPYVDLKSYELLDIREGVQLINMLAANLSGLDQLYGIRGMVPQFEVHLDVEAENPQDEPINLIAAGIPESFSFYPNDSARAFVPNMTFSVQLNSAKHSFRAVDDYLLKDRDVKLFVKTPSNGPILSRLLSAAKIELSLKKLFAKDTSKPTASPTPAPSGPDNLDVSLSVVSTNTAASILASIKVLEELPIKFVWKTIQYRLFDGPPATSQEIGSLLIPGTTLMAANSGPQNIDISFSNSADVFLQRLLNRSEAYFGFEGSYGASSFQSSFMIPSSLDFSNIGGDEDDDDDSSGDSEPLFELLDVAILGADEPGSSGTFPCPLDAVCSNTIKNDNDGPFQGLSAGATLKLALPKIGRIRWKVALESMVSVDIEANGALIGSAVLFPLRLNSSYTIVSPMASIRPNNAGLGEFRSTLSQVLDGYDTSFAISGSKNANYLSKLLSAIRQEVEILDIPAPDPDAPGMLGDMTMSLFSTVRNKAVIDITLGLTFNREGLKISVGSLEVEVRYGHTKTCNGGNQWCIGSGYHIATVTTFQPLVLTASELEQMLTLRAEIMHQGGVQSLHQQAVDSIVSAYIWSFEIPLEVTLKVTPVAGNPYGVNNPFSITLFATLPRGPPESEFIADIAVDITGTITSAIQDIQIKAGKTLMNTLDFPLLVSHFEYVLKLVDTDGVQSGGCGPQPSSGLIGGVSPCWVPGNAFCYAPWATPTAVGNKVTSGDLNQLRPGKSILRDNQKYLAPNRGTGVSDLSIDTSTETTMRLVDEMMLKGTMCGELDAGIVVVGLQANSNCNDETRAEADLTCTFPIRIKFSLPNYPLSDIESCGSRMEIPSTLGFTFYEAGVSQFNEAWMDPPGPALNPGVGNAASTVQLLSTTRSSGTRSSPTPLSIEDSFQIEFEARVDCVGEGLSLSFFSQKPQGATYPRIVCTGDCEGHYASNGIATTGKYASLVLAFRDCNSIAWIVQGNISVPYRGSKSICGGFLDNNNWGKVIFTYNAHDKRAMVSYEQGTSFPRRYYEFDLDLKDQLGGVSNAYIAMVANSNVGLITGCSYVGYRNFKRRSPRTSSAKTTLEGGFSLFRAGEIGTITFRARDENGRKRGKGGNSWAFEIRDKHNVLVPQDPTVNPSIIDNQDGTYTMRYRIHNAGRYTVKVACVSSDCTSAGAMTNITTGLFVRSPAS